MEEETIGERGRGVSAQLHQEMPLEYVARIRQETQGGRLAFVDASGAVIGSAGPLDWPLPARDDGQYKLISGVAPELAGQRVGAAWLRLFDAHGRDVGWRGPYGYATIFEDDRSLVELHSLTIYPPR
jgi:hypothetical protein